MDKDQLTPNIAHISDQELGKETMKISENVREIRQRDSLTHIIQEEPETETWINQAYTEQDVDREIRNLSDRKAHGNDGIPGDAHKETRQWEIKTITKIAHLVKEGHPIPKEWGNGAIVYIYKIEGDSGECGDYRPICLTRIIYKMWSGLIARKLTKATHILTSKNRYGYREGISTIDALFKAEQYIEL